MASQELSKLRVDKSATIDSLKAARKLLASTYEESKLTEIADIIVLLTETIFNIEQDL